METDEVARAWQQLRREMELERAAPRRHAFRTPGPPATPSQLPLPAPDPDALKHREQLAVAVGMDPRTELMERPGDRYDAEIGRREGDGC